MSKVLTQKFFTRKANLVAPELLGKYLVRKIGGRKTALMITETEAYDGFEDKASHASRGLTERNKVMFGPPGRFYVYLIYGMYEMLNIVTGEKGYPSAVLIRGVENFNGPGKLTQALKISRQFNGKLAAPKNDLWLEDRGVIVKKKQIIKTARVGVHYAGSHWSRKPWRFVLNCEQVSV